MRPGLSCELRPSGPLVSQRGRAGELAKPYSASAPSLNNALAEGAEVGAREGTWLERLPGVSPCCSPCSEQLSGYGWPVSRTHVVTPPASRCPALLGRVGGL